MILNMSDQKKVETEIIMSFNIENFSGKYVIYKINDEYYGAKYRNNQDITELITDLNLQEKEAIEKIFNECKDKGIIND